MNRRMSRFSISLNSTPSLIYTDSPMQLAPAAASKRHW